MKLRILADQLAAASINLDGLRAEIKLGLRFDEIEVHEVGDRYGDYQVGGAVNPRGLMVPYNDRKSDDLLRVILTGYELRTPDRGNMPAMSRAGVATVVSTQRLQGAVTQVATATIHGLFHQVRTIKPDAPQHDPRNPGHCKNRCVMRPVENLGALRRVADDWSRGHRLCSQCVGLLRSK
ncbi:MAG TPA: hypothetical protein VFS14_00495 [Candidatus Saccharimonadales bacterium]|nr:hypothetical protein [Candidatus Saccharimonadales bacterium]